MPRWKPNRKLTCWWPKVKWLHRAALLMPAQCDYTKFISEHGRAVATWIMAIPMFFCFFSSFLFTNLVSPAMSIVIIEIGNLMMGFAFDDFNFFFFSLSLCIRRRNCERKYIPAKSETQKRNCRHPFFIIRIVNENWNTCAFCVTPSERHRSGKMWEKQSNRHEAWIDSCVNILTPITFPWYRKKKKKIDWRIGNNNWHPW